MVMVFDYSNFADFKVGNFLRLCYNKFTKEMFALLLAGYIVCSRHCRSRLFHLWFFAIWRYFCKHSAQWTYPCIWCVVSLYLLLFPSICPVSILFFCAFPSHSKPKILQLSLPYDVKGDVLTHALLSTHVLDILLVEGILSILLKNHIPAAWIMSSRPSSSYNYSSFSNILCILIKYHQRIKLISQVIWRVRSNHIESPRPVPSSR